MNQSRLRTASSPLHDKLTRESSTTQISAWQFSCFFTRTVDSLLTTRRTFCSAGCRLVSLLAVESLLPSCANPLSPANVPSLPTMTATVSGGNLSVNVGASSALAQVGSAALVESSRGSFLVARTGAASFTALGATCTHQTCTITGFGSQKFVCPCHGSQFDTNGHVVQGPAPAALPQYSTQFANDVLIIVL